MALISCITVAYTINKIGVTIDNLNRNSNQFNQEMVSLTTYMRSRGVKQDTQLRIKRYYEYLQNENIKGNLQNEKLLQDLTGSLKQDVYKEMYLQLLKK